MLDFGGHILAQLRLSRRMLGFGPFALPSAAMRGHSAAQRRCAPPRKVDARLPDERNSSVHGARPVHLIFDQCGHAGTLRTLCGSYGVCWGPYVGTI